MIDELKIEGFKSLHSLKLNGVRKKLILMQRLDLLHLN